MQATINKKHFFEFVELIVIMELSDLLRLEIRPHFQKLEKSEFLKAIKTTIKDKCKKFGRVIWDYSPKAKSIFKSNDNHLNQFFAQIEEMELNDLAKLLLSPVFSKEENPEKRALIMHQIRKHIKRRGG